MTAKRRRMVTTRPRSQAAPHGIARSAATSSRRLAKTCFLPCLAVSVAKRCPLTEAGRFAKAAAALSVKKVGVQPSAPNCKDIEALLAG